MEDGGKILNKTYHMECHCFTLILCVISSQKVLFQLKMNSYHENCQILTYDTPVVPSSKEGRQLITRTFPGKGGMGTFSQFFSVFWVRTDPENAYPIISDEKSQKS